MSCSFPARRCGGRPPGPGCRAAAIRAAGEDAARLIAARYSFVLADLRTFSLHRWPLNETSHRRLDLAGYRNL